MDSADEARMLRHRMEALTQAVDRLDRPVLAGCHTLVLITATETTYPTTAAEFFACHVASVGGTEAEGATPSVSPGTPLVYALNVGTKRPPSGTKVIAGLSQGLWCFQYDGTES